MIDVGDWDQQVREHLWRDLVAEHRHLARVLDDVASLVEEGSFETARRRFGEYRREVAAFLGQLEKERARVLEQSERVWSCLCREKRAPVPRLLERLSSLVAEHERAQRRLILAELPLSPELRNAQGVLLRRLGHL